VDVSGQMTEFGTIWPDSGERRRSRLGENAR
jgi:hypothetical protein